MSVRCVIVWLSFLAAFIQVTQRYNLSIAIIAMVNNTAFEEQANNSSYLEDSDCPAEAPGNLTTEFPKGNLLWSPADQGIILSAYFYGYSATQIFGGRWSERWGGKLFCGAGVLLASFCTLLTPFAADYFIVIFIIRVLIGCFHGLIYSSLYAVFNKWVPNNERATAAGGVLAAGNLGGAICLPFVSYVCSSPVLGGWRSSFYILSCIGFVWSIIWFLFMTDTPEQHPRISEKELKYIIESTKQNENSKAPNKVPWTKMIFSMALWASLVAKATGTFAYYVLTVELPSYMENVLNVSITENGFLNSYNYLMVTVSLYFSGRLTDLMKSKKVISTTLIRKIFQGFAMSGQILLILIPFFGCDKQYVIGCIMLSFFIYGFIGGGELPISLEYAPKYSGTVFGISNFFASVTGILAPVFVGFLLNDNVHDREKWNIVFNTCAGVSTFGLLFFSVFATAEPTKWSH